MKKILVFGYGLATIIAPAFFVQISFAQTELKVNYEHCVQMNEYPPKKYVTSFPKGTKKMQNICPYDIYVGWCFKPAIVGAGPLEKPQCGFKGKYLQKGWIFKSGYEYPAAMDIYQKLDVVACKGRGKSSYVFTYKDAHRVEYYCK
jgi:hypothetical protein